MRKPQSFINVLLFLLSACVGEGAYEVPKGDLIPPKIDFSQILSIGTLHAIWRQHTQGDGIHSLDDSFAEKYVEGYVISSDETGNFFEELYLQDNPENPQKGIKLLIDSSPLYTRFNFGRKIYIKLQGISLGISKGVFSMGMVANNTIAPISEALMGHLIYRDTLVADVVPRNVSIGALSPEMMNLYLRLDDVQFHRSQLVEGALLTYAGEPNDIYDGERLLESCSDYSKLLISTSSYADFKGATLEGGRGFIDGIALFDYYGERIVFKVNDLEAFKLHNQERCDPPVVQCENAYGGPISIWEEDFENYNDLDDLIQEGWTFFNPLSGETFWELDDFGGNNYLKISGYNSGELIMESWLIGPTVQLGATEEEILTFDLQTSYDNGARLLLLVSGDYDENPEAATWQQLDVSIPPGPYEGFGDSVTIGPISLSCFEGSIVLAWVYEGSDPFKTTRFHVDNIQLKGT